jgi:hypothetical protein
LQEAWLLVVPREKDEIMVHGVEHSRLIVELDLEVVQAQQVQGYCGNFASIEAAITESRPPLVWDVQAETH